MEEEGQQTKQTGTDDSSVVTASSSVSVYPPKPETLTEPSVVGRLMGSR